MEGPQPGFGDDQPDRGLARQGAALGRDKGPTVTRMPPISVSQARHVCSERAFGQSLIRVSSLPEIAAETLAFSALITSKDGGKITPFLLRHDSRSERAPEILAAARQISGIVPASPAMVIEHRWLRDAPRSRSQATERILGFRIYKWVGSQAIWLKSVTPVIRWGPPGQAMSFGHRAEAIRALNRAGFPGGNFV